MIFQCNFDIASCTFLFELIIQDISFFFQDFGHFEFNFRTRDFNHFMTQLKDVEKKIADIEEEMSLTEEGTAAYTALEKKLEAANKAYTYVRDNIQTKFENQITKYQQYMDDSNIAITNNATRGSRLDLISDRLMNQKTTFKELQSNNEDIDVTEVAVELSSADLTYQAALMATSKIMQTNLMNYI